MKSPRPSFIRKSPKWNNLLSLVLTVPLLSLMLNQGLFAQAGATGAISGIVTDSQGGAVQGAEVQATHLETGVVTRTTINSAGVYSIPYLPIGNYEVRIRAAGMKEAVVTGVLVVPNNISRVDPMLDIGAVSESVRVVAEAPLLQQESTAYDAAVNRKFVEARHSSDTINAIEAISRLQVPLAAIRHA